MSQELVESAIEKFRNSDEKVAVRLNPINHEGVIYRYAVYTKNKQVVGSIIVTIDGKILPLDQIKDVLWMALEVYGTELFLMGDASKWAKGSTKLFKRQLEILSKVENSFDLPADIKKSFAQFKSVPKTLQEEQEKLAQAVQEGVEYNLSQKDQEITIDTDKRMTEYFRTIRLSKYQQLNIMVVTDEDRKKLIAYLGGKVSIMQPKKWLLYKDLKAQDRSFSVSGSNFQAYEDAKKDIWGEKAGKEAFKGTMKRNRNPKVLESKNRKSAPKTKRKRK
ncbi:MAG TPA: hypothetical protein VFC84_18155 [Desulfosporosinus sp.]|nr:hypothetical protein [Desulfosporosinus sp.]